MCSIGVLAHDDDDVSFYNSTASTWTLATPRTTWESHMLKQMARASIVRSAWPGAPRIAAGHVADRKLIPKSQKPTIQGL